MEGLGATDDRVPPLVSALQRILPPLVRLLLRHRFTFPLLGALLKEIYVAVAIRELETDGARQTDSQVSLMTGVHRKDVRRLRHEAPRVDAIPASASRGSQVALRWITTARYQDAAGSPLPLPRTAATSEQPCFNELVESISKDVRPRAILEELLRLGVAELDREGRVCLRVEGFVPEAGFDEKAFYFGRSVRDHVAAAAHNLLGERPALFERSVYYENLTLESVRELEELSNLLAMDALRAVNRRGATLRRQDAERPDAHFRVTLGAYFFRAKQDTEDDAPR